MRCPTPRSCLKLRACAVVLADRFRSWSSEGRLCREDIAAGCWAIGVVAGRVLVGIEACRDQASLCRGGWPNPVIPVIPVRCRVWIACPHASSAVLLAAPGPWCAGRRRRRRTPRAMTPSPPKIESLGTSGRLTVPTVPSVTASVRPGVHACGGHRARETCGPEVFAHGPVRSGYRK